MGPFASLGDAMPHVSCAALSHPRTLSYTIMGIVNGRKLPPLIGISFRKFSEIVLFIFPEDLHRSIIMESRWVVFERTLKLAW